MKYRVNILLIILLTIFNPSAFAYISKKSTDLKKISCPEKIECVSSEHDIICKFKGDNLQYWKDISKPWKNKKGMPVGDYVFYKATMTKSYYTNYIDQATCSYEYVGPNPFPVNIEINNQDNVNLEVIFDKNTNWNNDGSYANCMSDNPLLCPLFESGVLVIGQTLVDKDKNYLDTKLVDVAVNHKLFQNLSRNYFKITYDDALIMCGSVEQCTFYIKERGRDFSDFDSVTVDLKNNMKILQVNSEVRNDGYHQYQLLKHDVFNMVGYELK